MNAENTILLVSKSNGSLVIEPDSVDWHLYSSMPNIEPFVDSVKVNSIDVVTPAQMRLALYRAGLLDQVQAIADSDPEASIVWEYATTIYRNSPFIEALKGNFTDEQIDDLFATAAKIL